MKHGGEADQTDEIERVARALLDGDVAVVATDTVYGLLADPRSPAAMARLLELKGRPESVPIAVLIASLAQAEELVEVGDEFARLAARHWPGALTLVAPVRPDADLVAGTGTTLGVRCPDDDFIRSLAHRFGPIAATSANRHGEPPVVDGVAAREVFGGTVEVIVDGGRRGGRASTVVDVTGPEPVVLRGGDVVIE